MIDLDQQIRDYYDRIIIPVTTDEYSDLVAGRPIAVRLSRAWVLAAAFVVVLISLGVTILVRSGNGGEFTDRPAPTVPVTQAPNLRDGDNPETGLSAPVAVFDIDADTLCEWFSADDMNQIVATAQQRAGTDYVFEDFAAAGCDNNLWKTPSFSWGPNRGDSLAILLDLVDDQENPDLASAGNSLDEHIGHPLLADGISFQLRTNQFFWQEGLDGYLLADGHEEEILYFGFGVDNHDSTTTMSGEYNDLGLAVANELLQRMHWIEPGIFSWDTDDLGEWVTQADMSAALEDYWDSEIEVGAGLEYVPATQATRFDEWQYGIAGWRIYAHNGDHDGDGVADVETTMTDPRLPEGVSYGKGEGFAWMSYILSGPNSDQSICLTAVAPPRSGDPDEDLIFAVASMMLREMGWTD